MVSPKAIPEGFHSVTPHMIIKDAGRAIDWYTKAFGAEEICRMPGPDGKLMHAQVRIGDSVVMLCDEFPEMQCRSPETLGGSPVGLHIYVPDVDSAFKRAVDAGAQTTMPVSDMFWGDRYGKLKDPFGHEWSIATHKEDLTPEEMGRRGAEAMKSMGEGGHC